MRKVSVIITLLTLGATCSTAGRGGRSLGDGPVEFSVILSGSHSQEKDYKVELITNKRQWEHVWQVAKGNEDPLPSQPTVDFGRQYVIAAFMGERPSSGYQIEITSIEKRGRTLQVLVKKYETPGMLTVMTHPFTLVRVPKGYYKLEVTEETVR